MANTFKLPDLEGMKSLPALPIPDYQKLNKEFLKAMQDPKNQMQRTNPVNGHPVFGAYLLSDSNEMVTWGILAVGHWLLGYDTAWLAPSFLDFFSEAYGLFLNEPHSTRSEHWYLFYTNVLAGAVQRTLYRDDVRAAACMRQSASAMKRLAQAVSYDFNQQGFDFKRGETFTHKDIYRQPDSIAGYAYQMLYASQVLGLQDCLEESVCAIRRYQAFAENPWYEIPNGSAGLFAAAWLRAHGYENDVEKTAGWVFDHEKGPLQTGLWGSEPVNGLMMGWRGDTRAEAETSAYSMESLMPLQFVLPAVRYAPELAEPVANWVRHLLSAFQLFYGRGVQTLQETRPELTPAVPYERLVRGDGAEEPIACGDFCGHRSVYGAGYLMWVEALIRPTQDPWIFALDLTLTDWVSPSETPVYLIQNPYEAEKTVSFTAAARWEKTCGSGPFTVAIPPKAHRFITVKDCEAVTGQKPG